MSARRQERKLPGHRLFSTKLLSGSLLLPDPPPRRMAFIEHIMLDH
jgi:hypothetical protein